MLLHIEITALKSCNVQDPIHGIATTDTAIQTKSFNFHFLKLIGHSTVTDNGK